jgi:hypothetical protein
MGHTEAQFLGFSYDFPMILAVGTFFHPANRPIDFLKSFCFGFFY